MKRLPVFLKFTLVVFLNLFMFNQIIFSLDLSKGTKVWAEWTWSKWYHGTIDSVCDDGYMVIFDDGDKKCISSESIAIDKSPSSNEIKNSIKVIAKWSDGIYYSGSINSIEDDKYNILYEDGTLYSVVIDDIRIRLPQEVKKNTTKSTIKDENDKTDQKKGEKKDEFSMDTKNVLLKIFDEARNKYQWVFSLTNPVKSKDNKFSDNTIEIQFTFNHHSNLYGPYNLALEFTNKSNESISIIWDKTFLTSLKGVQREVFHLKGGSVNTGSQQNTLVSSKLKIVEALFPKGGANFKNHEGYWDENGKWHEPWTQLYDYIFFFGDDFPKSDTYDDIKKDVVSKEFKLILALLVGNKAKDYTFTFKIEDIIKTRDESKSDLEDTLKQKQ